MLIAFAAAEMYTGMSLFDLELCCKCTLATLCVNLSCVPSVVTHILRLYWAVAFSSLRNQLRFADSTTLRSYTEQIASENVCGEVLASSTVWKRKF